MKGEYRRWKCDRCNHAVLTALDAEPEGWWHEMHVTVLRKYPEDRREQHLHLCNDCSSAFDRWLRNNPPQIIVHESRWQELEEATRPRSPFVEAMKGTPFEDVDIEPNWRLVECIVGADRAAEMRAQHEAAIAARPGASS